MKRTVLFLLFGVIVIFSLVSCTEPHMHVFDREVVSWKYLKSSATCTSKAVYYRICECGQVSKSDSDTFEAGEYAPHVYDQKNESDEFLKSEGTCQQKAVYYKSCVCGSKGSETFKSDYGTHVFDQQAPVSAFLVSEANHEHGAIYQKSCFCGMTSTSVDDRFEYGDPIPHVFNQNVVDSRYKLRDASCTQKALYARSCSCGAASTIETFEFGELLEHEFKEQVVNPKYLVSSACCEHGDVYHLSCKCGLASPTDTFEVGEAEHGNLETIVSDVCYYCSDCERYVFADKTTQIFAVSQNSTYTSLQTALDFSDPGETIILNRDLSLDETLVIDKGVILNLNGHTITGPALTDEWDACCIRIEGSTDFHVPKVVISNGTVKGSYAGFGSGVINAFLVEDLYLDDLNVINTASDLMSDYSCSLYVLYSNVEITNSPDNVFKGRIQVEDDAEKEESFGFIRSRLMIDGGVYACDMYSCDAVVLSHSGYDLAIPVSVDNANFIEGELEVVYFGIPIELNLEFREGSYSFDPSAYVPEGYSVSGTGPYIVTKN